MPIAAASAVPGIGASKCGAVPASDISAVSGGWTPAAPLVSMLPLDWNAVHQQLALSSAWHDILHFEEQLSSTYAGWTDEQWLQAIQQNLLSGESFYAGSLLRHVNMWQAFVQMTGVAGVAVVEKVLSWLQNGYSLTLVNPLSTQQQLHPHFEARLDRARKSLAAVIGAHQVESYLQGTVPKPIVFPNNASCTQYADFVRSELATYVRLGAARVWNPQCPWKLSELVVHPMSVAIHPTTGKMRLCMDANYTNIFEVYEPVQFELLPDVFSLVQNGDWGFVTDCTKGYFHVALSPQAQRLLCVSFEGNTYIFNALPFGLSSAVKAYTDIMTVAYMPMRRQGRRFSYMIDDRIGLAGSRQACWLDIFITVRIMCALGFHLGIAKCVLWPQQSLLYLGLILDLAHLSCRVPDKKLQKFAMTIIDVLSGSAVTPRLLSRIAGMVISFALAVPFGKLYTRQLYLAMTGKLSWDQALPIGKELHQHLLWLQSYVSSHNGCHWFRRLPGVVLISDASVKGVGGAAASCADNASGCVLVSMQSQIPTELQLASSTCREAVGVLSLFKTLLQQPDWLALLQHRAVKILTDNQGVAYDVQSMHGAASIFPHILLLYELAAQYDIEIQIEWRPREHQLMQYADMHSKLIDVADWSIDPAVFTDLCRKWNVTPTVDWFARTWSAKCSTFYSRYLMPGCAGVDAFDFCWALPSPKLSYVCPPHMIVARVLRKILDEHANCILIIPAWYKMWHAMLSLLPITHCVQLPGNVIQWGDRAPESAHRCHALMAGLYAYLIQYS